MPVGNAPGGSRSTAVQEWIESAFLDEATFRCRLQAGPFEEEVFGSLVSGRPFRADPAAVEWAGELERVLATPAGSMGHVRTEVCGEELDRLPFEGLLSRFLVHFGGRLDETRAGSHGTVVVTVAARGSLVAGLAERLVGVSHRTLVRALAQERTAGRLRGADPAARYRDYDSRMLGDAGHLEQIFTDHPLLGRTMVECGRRWLHNSVELLERLDADLADLRAAGLATDSYVVTRIETGMGDPHNGGRAVARVVFDDGSSVVHKPRSVEPERLYADAAALAVRTTPGISLRAMRTLPRAGYGWCEFLAHEECENTDEVRRYHRNLGSALAVLHVLGAIDMHMGNVMAIGSSPVPVDLETVLQHTEIAHRESRTANEKALDLLARSVLATGILPVRMFGNGVDAGLDVSALGGGAAQTSARPLPTLVAPFTDEMRIEARSRTVHGGYNRPRLGGALIDPARHRDTIVEGFCDTFDAVVENRARYDALLERAATVPVRHLVRNTRRYDLFRYERYHPDYLRDGADADRLLDKLWAAAVTRKDLRPLVEAERRALLVDDIPSFGTTAGSQDLAAGGRTLAPDFFAEPSVTTARRRLAGLDAEHRAVQVAVLGEAIGLTADAATVARRPSPVDPAACDRRVGADEIRRVIRRTLDDLADEAHLGARDCTWIAVGADGVRDETLTIRPLTTTLYDGLAGTALVYGYAARLFDDGRYADIGRRSAAPVVTELETLVRTGRDAGCVGAFAGVAGSVYALHHLAHLGQSDRTDHAGLVGDALSALPALVEQERSPDVVAGLAGCAVVAAGLIHDYGDAAVRVVRRCTDLLVRSAVRVDDGVGWPFRDGSPLMGGFAHGAAGIGWSLLVAGHALGDGEVTGLGLRAMAYDEGLRVPGEDGWRDLRGFADRTGIEQRRPTLWCHGATGIGLSRLLAGDLTGVAGFEAEACSAVRATCAASPLTSQGLCHGDSGSVEFLDLAADRLAGRPEAATARATADTLTAATVTAIASGGFDFGPISGPKVPGLMMGRSGVALALMRRLDRANAPGVLWLEPPHGSAPRGPGR